MSLRVMERVKVGRGTSRFWNRLDQTLTEPIPHSPFVMIWYLHGKTLHSSSNQVKRLFCSNPNLTQFN